MTEQDGLPFPQRYWAILTIVLGIVMAVLDGAIANVALPTIAQDLHATPSFSVCIVNGYQLAITISLLPLAALGEIIGYRRVYLVGLLVFTVASLCCALSHTLVLLTASRVLQGFGAAGIMSVNAALVRFTYPRAQLGHGIGIAAIDSVGHGERPLLYVSEFIIAVVAGVILVRRERHTKSPLLPVDLLRIPIFSLSILTSIASFCAQMLAFVALPFYLEDRFGYSAVQIGLLITPWPLGVGLTAPLAGRMTERYSAGLLGGVGLVVFAGGLAALAMLPLHPTTIDIVWRMALAGAGFGMFQSPNNRTMIAAAPRERSGGASGMLGTARLLGQTTGAALVALLLARYAVEGTRISLVVGVGFALAGAALSMLRLSEVGAKGGQAVRVLEAPRATEQR